MKKSLVFLLLILSIFLTANAGYIKSTKTEIIFDNFELNAMRRTVNIPFMFEMVEYTMPFEEICREFNEEEPMPELLMPIKEASITTYNNHIIVKDLPNNTAYQIYTITGQLLQTF